jgi:hypothetical protein
LWTPLTGRTFNEHLRWCAEEVQLILATKKPTEDSGRVNGAAVFEAALKRPVGQDSLSKPAEFQRVVNHTSRILPSTQIAK